MIETFLRTCSICKKDFPLESFSKQPKGKDGRQANCKNCQKEYFHKYYLINKEKKLLQNKVWKDDHREQRSKTDRLGSLRRKFGLSEQDYQNLLDKQNSLCAICRSKNSNNSRHKYLSVDHDHLTGKVRGLLCDSCNVVLGRVKDNILVLESAIRYLKGA